MDLFTVGFCTCCAYALVSFIVCMMEDCRNYYTTMAAWFGYSMVTIGFIAGLVLLF